MGGACSTHRNMRNLSHNVVWGISRDDTIWGMGTDLRGTGCGKLDWIELVQDSFKWTAYVYKIMNCGIYWPSE
jgi:hypothetical protein